MAIGEILLDTNSDVLDECPKTFRLAARPQLQLALLASKIVARNLINEIDTNNEHDKDEDQRRK